MKVQCDAIVESLEAALAATVSAAPARSTQQTYRLRHDEQDRVRPKDMGVSKVDPTRPVNASKEALLENAIFERWGLGSGSSPIAGLWRTIVTRQVPLFDKRKKEGWGHIDLLALSDSDEVTVVELKKAASVECPLRPLVQAVSYAVALRKGWNVFSSELSTVLKEDSGTTCELRADTIPVVVLAPRQYWERWGPDGDLGGTLSSSDWDAFGRLVAALGSQGYPVALASIGGRLPKEPDDSYSDDLTIGRVTGLPPKL